MPSFASFSNFYCCRSYERFSDNTVLQASLISTVVDINAIPGQKRVLQASLISTVVDSFVFSARYPVLQASLISTVVDSV